MKRFTLPLLLFASLSIAAFGQNPPDGDFRLSLPSHKGQLIWSAPGFQPKEFSVKPNGNEIGVRAIDASGKVTFLSFLFLVPEQAPATSTNCMSNVIEGVRQTSIPLLKITATSELPAASGPPVAMVSYAVEGQKTFYTVRAFVATEDICGDLEIYSEAPLRADDPTVKAILASYRLDEKYVPQFKDALLYAQLLYNKRMYKDAGPVYEVALSKLAAAEVKDAKTLRRVLTDQAGMSYGISGDLAKARAIFEAAIASDPDYPLYYYNLACADAEEKKLDAAKMHLQQAFERKTNVLPGEKMPDPTKDDSFLPHQGNKAFWAFLTKLQATQ